MSCAVLKQMCLSKSHGSCLLDQHFAQLIAAREKVVQHLAQFVQVKGKNIVSKYVIFRRFFL